MQVPRTGVGVIQATRVRQSGPCELQREDAVNGRMIAKIFAIFTVVMMVLRLMLTSVLPMAGSWSAMVGKAVLEAAFVIAVRISFGVCRRLWPATA
jgi:hypothetical protein